MILRTAITAITIALDDSERSLQINYLNDLRNSLISEGRYTDALDGVLLKIINVPVRKFNVICKGRNKRYGEIII